jgi:hypothetical protein
MKTNKAVFCRFIQNKKKEADKKRLLPFHSNDFVIDSYINASKTVVGRPVWLLFSEY